MRSEGAADLPTVVYFPGLHGDWFLTASIREVLRGQVRWVEFSYPSGRGASLVDHVVAIRERLATADIRSAWILGESFGSQIAWEFLESVRKHTEFEVRGLILVGGFVRYPWPLGIRLVQPIVRHLPGWILGITLRGYLLRVRGLGMRSPAVRDSLEQFVARRLEPADREALLHRLDLILASDPRRIARDTRVPVWSLMGLWDPIVPWPPVRRWLRRECPGWRGDRVLWGADHAPLVSAPERSAEVILGWLRSGGENVHR
jgi:pimeloyl-ACP methyl ester carboxylesterase